jgi:hypothetical protein
LTSTELAKEVCSIIEAKILGGPSPVEFEMAYQMRIGIEKLRFAIRAMDTIGTNPMSVQEISFQLLDALNRLEKTERHFQSRQEDQLLCQQSFSSGKNIDAEWLTHRFRCGSVRTDNEAPEYRRGRFPAPAL